MAAGIAALAAQAARPKVAAILTCHNRRELTLRALRSLDAARDVFDLSVVLLDDGSTDGTADAVRTEFPDAMVIAGDGSFFWNRGMHAAWSHALALEPDAYLWLNDDVALDQDAFDRLRDAWREAAGFRKDQAFVLVGTTRNARGEFTYGGFRRSSRWRLSFERLGETAKLTPVDTLNGNIVLVPAVTVRLIGINDPSYFHMYGDIDYGLRATGRGIPVLQMPSTQGVCESNPGPDLSKMSLAARWRYLLRSPRGYQPRSLWRFARKHSGLLAPLHLVSPYRKLFYPGPWLRNRS
jgi:GT2 family glycosyltransferase